MWLSGYRRTLEGTPFAYASLAPGIRSALLVRGNTDRPTVAWETTPLPPGFEGDRVRFVWTFAFDANPTAVPFTLHVNDRPVVTFENPARADVEEWTIEGVDGTTLTFRATYHDRHGDPMGYAFLDLPAAALEPGAPVRIRITSEDLGVPVWTMVFEHEVTSELKVVQLPLARRDDGEDVRRVHLDCTHLGEDTGLVVCHEDREIARHPLRFGHNRVSAPLPRSKVGEAIHLDVAIGNEPARRVALILEPVKPWTIHLVQHTHTDIGYTRPQTEILPEHLRFLDYALDFCDETDDWPDDARFRWTCEASWPVREYLCSRPPEQIERLRRRVREGRIELTGMMFNLSEIPDEPSLAALLEPVKRLQEADLPVRLAMQNDVNGLAWCLADSLPSVGIESFVMGQHSHRALACFERPTAFWWESPSGSRLLGYRGDHYMTGNDWGIHNRDPEAFEGNLVHHLGDLEERGYPFHRTAIQYGGYVTDNAPPSRLGIETIRRWNEVYAWPRLRSATASEFLDWVREHHAADLPVHRAAWPDWWTDGFGSAARETAAARRTHADLIATQGLAAMALAHDLGVPTDWARRVQQAYDALLFYGEHTLGAAESISDPLCENSLVQWGEKAAYVWDAVKQTRILREAALGWLAPMLPRATEPLLVVLNPLAWTRSGTLEVYVDHEILPPDRAFRLLAPDGREVGAQALGSRSDGTTWLLDVPDVPPFGHLALRIFVDDMPRKALPAATSPVLENEHYRLEVDPARGTLARLFDKELGLDLVDADAPWGLLDVVYERLDNRHQLERLTLEDYERTGLQDVRIEPGVDGPIHRSLVVVGTAVGGTARDGVRLEIRLLKRVKRIQVAVTVHKLEVTEPEGVYVAFPFALPDAEVAIDVPGGFVVPGRDQLPGSSSDWHTVQNVACVRSDAAQILVTCDEAPLWQLGGLRLGEFRYEACVERPHLYSWVMNNYWVTNFCASQEGELRWSYELTSGPRQAASEVLRFGWGRRVPLVARVLPADREVRGEPTGSALRTELPEGLHLVTARPTEDGRALFLHVREMDGRPAHLDATALFGGRSVARVDAVGTNAEPVDAGVEIEPYGVRFLRIEP